MLLVIDAGNTNVTFGLFRGSELLAQWRLTTDRNRSSDEYGAQVRSLFESAGSDVKEVEAVAIVSVVPPLNPSLMRMVETGFGLTPLVVDHTTDTGLKILYESPSDLGADRIVDAVAAVTKYGAPCIVVDFGTSTNFDVVSAEGEYVGGVLAPGIEISMDALFERAARLRKVDFVEPPSVIGKTTVAALQSGVVYGFAGQVDGIVTAIRRELGTDARAIATGGLAELIYPHASTIERVDPFLTLEGLRLVWERNR